MRKIDLAGAGVDQLDLFALLNLIPAWLSAV